MHSRLGGEKYLLQPHSCRTIDANGSRKDNSDEDQSEIAEGAKLPEDTVGGVPFPSHIL